MSMPHTNSPAITDLERKGKREERRPNHLIQEDINKTKVHDFRMQFSGVKKPGKSSQTILSKSLAQTYQEVASNLFHRHFSLERNIKIGPAHPLRHLFPPHPARSGISLHQAIRRTVLLPPPACGTVCVYGKVLDAFF